MTTIVPIHTGIENAVDALVSSLAEAGYVVHGWVASGGKGDATTITFLLKHEDQNYEITFRKDDYICQTKDGRLVIFKQLPDEVKA